MEVWAAVFLLSAAEMAEVASWILPWALLWRSVATTMRPLATSMAAWAVAISFLAAC